LEFADRQDDDRRGLRRRTVRRPGVRWEQKGNRVLLQDVNFSVSADPKSPIASAVESGEQRHHPDVVPGGGLHKDGDPVIDVTRLFVPQQAAERAARRKCRRSAHGSIWAPQASTPRVPSSSTFAPSRRIGSGSDHHLHQHRWTRRSGCWRRTWRWRTRRRYDARQHATVVGAPQHGQAARKANDAAPSSTIA